jgi:hypothetical protein
MLLSVVYEWCVATLISGPSQQNAVDDVKEGGGFKPLIEKNRKLGPPGAPVKPYDRHPKTNTHPLALLQFVFIGRRQDDTSFDDVVSDFA